MERLRTHEGKPLNLVTCVDIYRTLFDALTECLVTAQTPLANEAANYLAQCYYDAVTINGGHQLDPNVFTQRARVENIPTTELGLLMTMLQGTDFAHEVIDEIKKRG